MAPDRLEEAYEGLVKSMAMYRFSEGQRELAILLPNDRHAVLREQNGGRVIRVGRKVLEPDFGVDYPLAYIRDDGEPLPMDYFGRVRGEYIDLQRKPHPEKEADITIGVKDLDTITAGLWTVANTPNFEEGATA